MLNFAFKRLFFFCVAQNSSCSSRTQRVVRPCRDVRVRSKQYERSHGTRRISNLPMHQEILCATFVDMSVCLSTRTKSSMTSYNFPTCLCWCLLLVPNCHEACLVLTVRWHCGFSGCGGFLPRKRRSTGRQTCPNGTLSSRNVTGTALRMTPDINGDKPAASRWRRGRIGNCL